MADMEERRTIQDPSANVIQLVGNAKQYLEDLHKQSAAYFEQKLQMTVDASRRERTAEAEKRDLLRSVDTEAVKVAKQEAIKQAELLANQLTENAETLRASMAKQAEALASQLQQVTTSLDSRLKIVEEKQYTISGTSKGRGDMWGWVAFGIMFIVAAATFIFK